MKKSEKSKILGFEKCENVRNTVRKKRIRPTAHTLTIQSGSPGSD